MKINPEQILEDSGFDIELLTEEETMLYRNPDFASAIIGISSDYHVIYDYELMIEHLMKYDDMTYEESVEWIDYNTLGAYTSEGKMPIIMYPIKQD